LRRGILLPVVSPSVSSVLGYFWRMPLLSPLSISPTHLPSTKRTWCPKPLMPWLKASPTSQGNSRSIGLSKVADTSSATTKRWRPTAPGLCNFSMRRRCRAPRYSVGLAGDTGKPSGAREAIGPKNDLFSAGSFQHNLPIRARKRSTALWSNKLRTTHLDGNRVPGTVWLQCGETFLCCSTCPSDPAGTVG
jgi:hypothetical protein